MSVKRTSLWLPASNNESIYTWLHHTAEYTKSLAVIIVEPVGPEYMHCYRSVKLLADQLAKNNILVARFDLPGMGNSSGNLEDNNIWDDWLNAPESVREFLSVEYGVKDFVVVSLRSASLLLESYISSNRVKGSVFWYPYIRGASFVRDMQALDSMLKLNSSDNVLNAGGYPLSEKSQNELKSINLNKANFKNIEHSLIIENAEVPGNSKLTDSLLSMGVDVDSIKLGGFTQMARQAALSTIPFDNINYIESWVCRLIEKTKNLTRTVVNENKLVTKFYIESIVHIELKNNIYGILTIPNVPAGLQQDTPLLILANAGVAHHIGPNRFHVDVARVLADQGVATFRMDLSNLGESVDTYEDDTHHPYPPTAAEDINCVVEYFKSEYGCSNIILSGLCSGAHNAFHAAVVSPSKINGLILINPLTFYWSQGQSIFEPEDNKDEIDSVYYQDQMFDLKKWLSLIINPKKLLSITGFVLRFFRNKLFSSIKKILKMLNIVKLDRLENDVNNIFNANVPISIIYSETDPGYNILLSQAGSVIKRGVKEKLFYSTLIKNADHTFSSRASRKKLISSIVSSVELMR